VCYTNSMKNRKGQPRLVREITGGGSQAITAKVGRKTYVFKVVVEEDPFDDGVMAYHVYVPALKGCRSWGYTVEEALKNIQEAVEVYLEDLKKHNEPIPEGPPELVTVFTEPVVAATI
jgi:predicted RNase H-like HicB family nuclease